MLRWPRPQCCVLVLLSTFGASLQSRECNREKSWDWEVREGQRESRPFVVNFALLAASGDDTLLLALGTLTKQLRS